MGVRRHSGVLVNIWRGAWLLGVAEHHREGEKGKGYSGVGDKKALLWWRKKRAESDTGLCMSG